jgi:hypothetical protein
VAAACSYGSSSADYSEVHYEALLQDPETELRRLTSFLGRSYDRRMMQLETSHEDVGEAKGQFGIVRDNTKKYLTQLRPEEVKEIERIVCRVARSTNYAMENDVEYRPLSRTRLLLFHLYDGYASLRHDARKEAALTRGIRYFLRDYSMSSWR